MLEEFSVTQKRALVVMTVIALGFGAYFLRSYVVLMAIAAVLAYLFAPLYRRLRDRFNAGIAATLTLLASVAVVGVPLAGVVALAVLQISQMVTGISHWLAKNDLTSLGQQLLNSTNQALAKVPFMHITLTPESVRETIAKVGQNAGQIALEFARESVGSLAGIVTSAIIFLYVFLALIVNGDKVLALFRDLNPLGPQVSDIYLAKVGAMVTATVRGQFVIATFQGVAGAISIYIGGIHDGFFMFVIFLTVLSFIPLGSGIVTIPLGIGMALFGNVAGGIFVVVFHIVVVTSIDNLLRPFLVPKSAHLNAALMLLAVFAGLKMFGFPGIVLGPVLMIIIVTTISVYLAVYKGAPLDTLTEDDDDAADDNKKTRWHRLWEIITQRSKPSAEEPMDPPGPKALASPTAES
ncbi:AI-2E family transporter [Mycolicibacterium komossense]|uniref:AI-2E family transporter n=1 Tax=Mycolicibacterium komossense TaxID=1779 RepID=A0ABT3C517_9MYCO|nr:AI-2E family transporter [Mycolicibacterium komossense]MCV7224554.1 AI-2E family transporter [Mycolicibacterium komossense]